MNDYGEEKWVALYQAAMLELSHALIARRIMAARGEILRRLEELRDMPGLHEPEHQSIQDALSGLRSLEKVEALHPDEQHREAAKTALRGPENGRPSK